MQPTITDPTTVADIAGEPVHFQWLRSKSQGKDNVVVLGKAVARCNAINKFQAFQSFLYMNNCVQTQHRQAMRVGPCRRALI